MTSSGLIHQSPPRTYVTMIHAWRWRHMDNVRRRRGDQDGSEPQVYRAGQNGNLYMDVVDRRRGAQDLLLSLLCLPSDPIRDRYSGPDTPAVGGVDGGERSTRGGSQCTTTTLANSDDDITRHHACVRTTYIISISGTRQGLIG
jgi:hypothetical protein